MWWNGVFGGPSLLGGVLMLVFWAVAVLLVLLAVRALFTSRPGSEQESALAILKRRYAAGEISQAEYELARRAIGGASSPV